MFLNGKPAVKVNAVFVLWGVSKNGKNKLYNIDGDKKWVPNSVCSYNAKEKTLLIEEWYYKKLFEDKYNVL